MPAPPLHRRVADLLGAASLAADGVAALSGVVEHAYHDVRHGPTRAPARLRGIPGFVHEAIERSAGLTARALGTASSAVSPGPRGPASSARHEAALAALNGVVGDHLAATGNPLAIPMRLLVDGRDPDAAPLPRNGRVLLLVHGLCMGPRQWARRGHDHGAALARALDVVPVYAHYNSGRHVSDNGRALADALERLVARWPVPVEELTILAHSMGGLVARSACHAATLASHAWPRALRRIVFLGTPHHGAPLERGGQRLGLLLAELPWAAAYGRLGRLRSAGITDLRHGNLLDADWAGVDRFDGDADRRTPLPLPAGVECHAFAASTGARGGRAIDALLGDGLVPVASALGDHPDPAFDLGFPDARRWRGHGMHHFDLLSSVDVCAELRARLAGGR